MNLGESTKMRPYLRALALGFFLLVFAVGTQRAAAADTSFTIAVIPDTQNYLDNQHQRAAGFPIDAGDIFLEQMQYVASQLRGRGGDIAFVTSVGDVWQSRVKLHGIPPERDASVAPMPKVAELEAPLASRGYGLIAEHVPFAVVPGNHDYDWVWSDAGQTRVGGLANFRAVFGEQSAFFKGKAWYVAAHDGGADSAQVFSGAGYRFLHIGLQFEASDASLAWARAILERYRGLPTIITTHKFLETDASRPADPARDSAAVAAQYNSPQVVWEKLVREHDQVFLVLSGHFNAQAHRVDSNRFGHQVHQVMSDYQNRHQVAKEHGLDRDSSLPVGTLGLGDGWVRLMTFDFAGATPSIHVRTYSTHYKRFSTDLPEYLAWYKQQEKPQLSDAEFLGADDFRVSLPDFNARFSKVAP